MSIKIGGMRVSNRKFHWSEILGGICGVLVMSAVKQPTPVILGIVGFLAGQIVVRTIRNARN